MIVPDWSGTIPVVNGDADSGDMVEAPPLSGGDETFGWSAPQGLENGKTITVSSDSLVFEQPTKQIYLGFGQGWLYNNSDGTPLDDLTIDGEILSYEYGAGAGNNRKIRTIGDQKYLHSLVADEATLEHTAGGMIVWDSGSAITNNDVAFQYSRSRCLVGINPEVSIQWKHDRIEAQPILQSTANSYYSNAGPALPNVGETKVKGYHGDGTSTEYYTKGPDHNGKFASYMLAWNPNTPDLTDGYIYTRCSIEDAYSFNRSLPGASGDRYPTGIITSASANRPRYFEKQDYIGNNNSGARNIDIDVTDIYWKVNGDTFLLADNIDLSLCTSEPIPLIPQSFSGDSKSVDLLLWRGSMANFSGKFLHRLDGELNVLNVVAL